MAKFSAGTATSVRAKSPLVVNKESRTLTFNLAPAFSPEAKTDLFLMAVTNMVGEKTFYEGAGERDQRYAALVQTVTRSDPDFVENLVPYIRNTAQLRSCAVVTAAEYCLAPGPNRRKVVNSAMARADDIAEFVGYWFSVTGSKTFPGGVQRGLADAAQRLYNPYAILKYDGQTKGVRMADVLNLVHAPVSHGKYIVDRRYGNEFTVVPEMVQARNKLMEVAPEERKDYAKKNPEQLKEAGVTWEWLSSWFTGGMDAKAWEIAIPNMGYMALLRNLRNFENAQISKETVAKINETLVDPEQVAKSRQLPFRFYSAYKQVGTSDWAASLETALDLSTKNIPEFEGSTLTLVDISGSMSGFTLTQKSTVTNYEIGALFGAALYAKNPKNTKVVPFATRSKDVTPESRMSTLKLMQKIVALQNSGSLDHGTDFLPAVNKHYSGQDRIVVFTDMQINPGQLGVNPKYIHTFDLQGYGRVPVQLAGSGRYLYGGFTDNTMSLMKILESGTSQKWEDVVPKAPWKVTA